MGGIPGFNLKGQFSYRLNSDVTRTTRDNYYFFDYYNGQLLQVWGLQRSHEAPRGSYYYAAASADYTFNVRKHNLFALAGYSQEETQSGQWDVISMLSVYSKLNYSYDDRFCWKGLSVWMVTPNSGLVTNMAISRPLRSVGMCIKKVS